MKYSICKYCSEKFLPARSNQLYCDRSCRNGYNNSRYKKDITYYKTLIDKIRFQDKLFETILSKSKLIVIKLEDFEKSGIHIESARRLILDKDGVLHRAEFGKYALVLLKNFHYKLCEL